MSTFTANSIRYHEPAVPLFLVMAAYAMTHLRRKDLKLFYVYCGVLLIALFAWNWLKLASRGLA
jgi:surface polysaccharide O-acyltransferase-like enzyme